MGVRLAAAKGIGLLSTWGLKYIFRRPAGNFPGKIALKIDPSFIADSAKSLQEGSLLVCGTNGKTTVTNLIAESLEQAGKRVMCNKSGANLASGVATTLLQGGSAQWGVFELDELWVAKVLPQLKPKYLLMLNLFDDQVDRMGGVQAVQKSIVEAFAASPETVFVYNADDPFCEVMAQQMSNKSIAFGFGETAGPGDASATKQQCQVCSAPLSYEYRQYGQLGAYCCQKCGFSRSPLSFTAKNFQHTSKGISFAVSAAAEDTSTLEAPYTATYMLYNVLASYVMASLLGVSAGSFQKTLTAFNPQNGRLQRFVIKGRPILLNLAKNPVGFNQNLSMIAQDEQEKIVAFFVNNKEGDGRDITWLEEVDFESLSKGTLVFVGGLCAEPLKLRLEKAGFHAKVVEGADDLMAQVTDIPSAQQLYVVANYTALAPLHQALSKLESDL